MRCVDYENFLTPDKEGKERIGIRFTLERDNGSTHDSVPVTSSIPRHKKPNRTERKGVLPK